MRQKDLDRQAPDEERLVLVETLSGLLGIGWSRGLLGLSLSTLLLDELGDPSNEFLGEDETSVDTSLSSWDVPAYHVSCLILSPLRIGV